MKNLVFKVKIVGLDQNWSKFSRLKVKIVQFKGKQINCPHYNPEIGLAVIRLNSYISTVKLSIKKRPHALRAPSSGGGLSVVDVAILLRENVA